MAFRGISSQSKPSIVTVVILSFVIASHLQLVDSQATQKFTYSEEDQMQVGPSSNLGLYHSLTTTSDEYLSASSIKIMTDLYQLSDEPDSTHGTSANFIKFNLLYFNLTNAEGITCYENWVEGSRLNNTQSCPSTIRLNEETCSNYSLCYDESVQYTIDLSQWQYLQNMFFVENVHSENNLKLYTKIQIELLSSNAWFFWAVALTCLLMIMIVVLTGVVFYLSLRIKKTKKSYEQFKLTVDNDIADTTAEYNKND